MAKRLVMIGGWTAIYEKAKACGFDLTVVQEKGDVKPRDLKICDMVIGVPPKDDGVVDLVAALHAHRPFDVVLSFQEFGVMDAAAIKERLGIAGNPMAPVLLTKNKGRMREHLLSTGVASIPFRIVGSAADAIDFGNQVGWPIIVKPIDGTGSHQIHKLRSSAEAHAAMASVLEEFPLSHPIAEKFISGIEVSVEAISWEGRHTVLGVTDKLTTGAPHFVETGHTMPSMLAPDIVARVNELARAFLDAIGHQYGPSHTEIIIGDDGPVIVESHTRTGGDRIYELVELAYGVDLFAATLQGFAGAFPDLKLGPARGAAIRFLTLPEGRVAAITGVDKACDAEGVVRCDVDVAIGRDIGPIRNSHDRYGYVLAEGESAAAAAANVERAMAGIDIEVGSAQTA